ncbi:hypothetical protein CC85DRAFT_149019 [Cutaneotrichosporon oleaginosum]|uniref:DNA lyase n=1 Tax=Cutaneotrichosporon oleaginosum TaxID=879819 RepID=A0A0J0XHS4_9TREE|nr:uncharacterized protein CC85DRAFT_149019 [Cutaneotrichosporon oleaginosum]KLT40557.1 hypothetical protein CC85DRAFT_149019 [Cutaneotrichosporon oleaginosum]TXT08372.1 hypothetical protein COLE_05296 [Cutaneotrichosporon oleaginosum]
MRLWSVSPALLDRAALIACWREALLAQKVLAGLTKGYTKHPQLTRFRAHPDPLSAIGFFLGELQREATARGYVFNAALIAAPSATPPGIPVHEGQVAYELEWLRSKVRRREPAWLAALEGVEVAMSAAASFVVVPGGIEEWEKIAEPKVKKERRKVKTEEGEGRPKVERTRSAPPRLGSRRSERLAATPR